MKITTQQFDVLMGAIAPRGDAWIQTSAGERFYPMHPIPEEVDVRVIAHALSNLCRFGGHSRRFYSVAEHSVLVSHCVPPQDALHALLHDAAEAYLVDVPRPLKGKLGNYRDIEDRCWLAIAEHFDLDPEMPESVKKADDAVLEAERRVLMPRHGHGYWSLPGVQPAPVWIWANGPRMARWRFMRRFNQLIAQR